MSLDHFPVDPSYGSGVYRRRLRIEVGPASADIRVDDTHHAISLGFALSGMHIDAVEAQFHRAPATTCPGAIHGLDALVGIDCRTPRKALVARLEREKNCTHLGDMAWWLAYHVARGLGRSTYDITVPDAGPTPVSIEILNDGEPLHVWSVHEDTIVAPASFCGHPLMKGFSAWASKAFSPHDFVTATMLHRGAWVARGRRYLVDQVPIPLSVFDMVGACFSYASEQLVHATSNVGYVRDFTSDVFEFEQDARTGDRP